MRPAGQQAAAGRGDAKPPGRDRMDPMTLRAATALLATLTGLGAGPATIALNPAAAAAAAPAAPAVLAAGAQRVCRIGDDRLVEISGLVATGTGYVVVNDGSDDAARRRIFFLDDKCSVVRTVSYPSRPRDTEDLAMAADGTLWVADIGDNSETRSTIALWRLAPGSRKPKLYRLSYPDGAHNAEALLLTPAGAPIVVTKAAVTATLYAPDGALQPGRTTPLHRAGSVSLPLTSTSNPFSLPGRLVVTGGAVSPDGRRAVLRTYADAFEFDVTGDDLAGAITKGSPRVIALPDEPQGESVAYSPDGTSLLTTSEVTRPGTKAELLRYPLPDRPATSSPTTSTTPAPSPAAAPPSSTAAAPADGRAATRSDRVPVGALVTGAILVAGAAALGVVLARRRRARRE
jgi:hypothetical protein